MKFDDVVFRRTDDNSVQMAIDGTTGGPYTFRIAAPDASTKWHISRVMLGVASSNTGWDSSAFADIANGLSNGVVLRHRKLSTSANLWKLTVKDNMDLAANFGVTMKKIEGTDKVLHVAALDFGLAEVTVTNDEVLEYMIKDNLSPLNNMKSFAHLAIE